MEKRRGLMTKPGSVLYYEVREEEGAAEERQKEQLVRKVSNKP